MELPTPAATPRRTFAALLLATTWPLALPAAAAPLDPRAFASLGGLDLAAGNYTLDSGGALPRLLDSASNVLAWGSLQGQADGLNPQIAVFSFDSLRIGAGASLRASGANPLALLSRTQWPWRRRGLAWRRPWRRRWLSGAGQLQLG